METSRRFAPCLVCSIPLAQHPRCALCGILVGPGHVEKDPSHLPAVTAKSGTYGPWDFCDHHNIRTLEDYAVALEKNRATQREFDLLPELIEVDKLERYPVKSYPEKFITPRHAAQHLGMGTGAGIQRIRLAFKKANLPQRAWAIGPAGAKSMLYDREAALLVAAMSMGDNGHALIESLGILV